jgi:hypothetical protein
MSKEQEKTHTFQPPLFAWRSSLIVAMVAVFGVLFLLVFLSVSGEGTQFAGLLLFGLLLLSPIFVLVAAVFFYFPMLLSRQLLPCSRLVFLFASVAAYFVLFQIFNMVTSDSFAGGDWLAKLLFSLVELPAALLAILLSPKLAFEIDGQATEE